VSTSVLVARIAWLVAWNRGRDATNSSLSSPFLDLGAARRTPRPAFSLGSPATRNRSFPALEGPLPHCRRDILCQA
jgi:hypothetical protein